MAKKLTPEKASEMLHNPPHGKPLTDKQRKYFGAISNMQLGGYIYPVNYVPQKEEGGWLDNFASGGSMQEHQENYNDSSVSMGPGFVGMGNNTKGRNYSPAWGGQFAMGGNLPGATGMMYARVGAPSKGPRRNQTDVTDASAQNGAEMSFYQNGLDWTPKNISRDGSVIKDDRGQWAHPGEITEIGSNQITMQGVPYPVLGVSDKGDTKMMYPGQDYKFKGNKVTEYPVKKNWLEKYK